MLDTNDTKITPRQRFIDALERKPMKGRVPHFELVFFLTMEAFGKVHPWHRLYKQWDQMSKREKQLHREDMADLYIQTAERFEHSAIFLYPRPREFDNFEEALRLIDIVREKSGDNYFLMLNNDATYTIPAGIDVITGKEWCMDEFIYKMADEPDELKKEADERVEIALARAEKLARHGGLDGFALTSDYAVNSGPFFSPNQFSEFITPYLARLIKGLRDMGFYTIKHTDGDIMPLLDQIVETKPHALHSLDPQAGVDIAEVKRLVGDQICLIGNVNCGLLETGTEQEVAESVRYALRSGMPGGGYIFSTSNCIYTGMFLERYEFMLDIWRKEGNWV